MARQETINIYKFSELSEQAKEKAVESFQFGKYADPDWHYILMEETLPEILKDYGFSADKQVYFSLDRNYFISFQGLYLDSIDKLFKKAGIKPRKTAFFDLLSDSISVEARGRNSEQYLTLDFYRAGFYSDRYNRIVKELERLFISLEQTFQEMKSEALKALQSKYDYISSKEYVEEMIQANDYEFLEDGSLH